MLEKSKDARRFVRYLAGGTWRNVSGDALNFKQKSLRFLIHMSNKYRSILNICLTKLINLRYTKINRYHTKIAKTSAQDIVRIANENKQKHHNTCL